MSPIEITDVRNLAPIANSPDAESAVNDLLAFWASEGRCYSSGEVAATLRIHRPDLSFSVPTLGGKLRDRFYSNTLPQYADDGQGNGPVSPVQRGRFTVGKYRTGAGIEVFVYGPNTSDCDTHEFEVFIPKWDANLGRMCDTPDPTTTAPSSASAPGTAQHTASQAAFGQTTVSNTRQAAQDVKSGKITIHGASSKVADFVASVWPDNRMAVGRGAFEALCHLSGTPIRAGSPIYVKVEPGVKATITMTDPNNGAKPYALVAGKGNVAFYSGDKTQPFTHGDFYKIAITATEITVDLTTVL